MTTARSFTGDIPPKLRIIHRPVFSTRADIGFLSMKFLDGHLPSLVLWYILMMRSGPAAASIVVPLVIANS